MQKIFHKNLNPKNKKITFNIFISQNNLLFTAANTAPPAANANQLLEFF